MIQQHKNLDSSVLSVKNIILVVCMCQKTFRKLSLQFCHCQLKREKHLSCWQWFCLYTVYKMLTVNQISYLHYRLLETDSKSLRSMNGSRRNSGSSLVSSSSASSNLSHLEEDSWILWGRIVNEWEEVRKKKEKQLKVRLVCMTTFQLTAESHADLLKSFFKHSCMKSFLQDAFVHEEEVKKVKL